MRSFVARGGIPTFISNSEYELLENIGELAYKTDLNERQAELARMLTSRGVLQRFMDADKGIYYQPNTNEGMD
jgi:hypothetical protein